jgi:formylglycine-generating enzyme required for sulfatase activity
MVLVPAGCFMMGNDDYALAELPVHEQCFEQPFWIDRYEVTNEQYGSIGCVESSSEPNQPRNCVDWIDATAHCENRGARLPTEREWEYGARGPDNFTYPWGNAFAANSVVFLDNAGVETASVGSRPNGLSWVGAFDMAGNLWEWMSTIFYDYPYVGDDGREDRNNINEGRVLRGGSFINGSSAFRAAMRGWNFPNGQDNETGFRCARSY